LPGRHSGEPGIFTDDQGAHKAQGRPPPRRRRGIAQRPPADFLVCRRCSVKFRALSAVHTIGARDDGGGLVRISNLRCRGGAHCARHGFDQYGNRICVAFYNY
jgi:hypothetical protein